MIGNCTADDLDLGVELLVPRILAGVGPSGLPALLCTKRLEHGPTPTASEAVEGVAKVVGIDARAVDPGIAAPTGT